MDKIYIIEKMSGVMAQSYIMHDGFKTRSAAEKKAIEMAEEVINTGKSVLSKVLTKEINSNGDVYVIDENKNIIIRFNIHAISI